MIIEQIYTGCLSQGSYYIESNGKAAVIDPLREISPYIEKAKKNIKYLKSKKIFGAGLDVYSEEPPKNIDTFIDLNLISTPHIGASTSEAQLKAGLDTVDNIKKILAGDTTVAI